MKLPKLHNEDDLFLSFGIQGKWWIYWEKKPIRTVIREWREQGKKVFSKSQFGMCSCDSCQESKVRQFWIYNLGFEFIGLF